MHQLKRRADRSALGKQPPSPAAEHAEPAAVSPGAALRSPGAATADEILSLQQSIGNRAVLRHLASSSPRERTGAAPAIQAKLTVDKPGDAHEQEADRVAREVTRRLDAPAPAAGSSPVRRHASATPRGREVDAATEAALAGARGGGHPLPEQVRGPMERALGEDFGAVRVHADARANRLAGALSARAFTTGNDLFFKQGQYAPESRGGQELLAHELTHVVQQRGSGGRDGAAHTASLGAGTVQRKITDREEHKDWYGQLDDDERKLVEGYEGETTSYTTAQVKEEIAKWKADTIRLRDRAMRRRGASIEASSAPGPQVSEPAPKASKLGAKSPAAAHLEGLYESKEPYKYTGGDANMVAWALAGQPKKERALQVPNSAALNAELAQRTNEAFKNALKKHRRKSPADQKKAKMPDRTEIGRAQFEAIMEEGQRAKDPKDWKDFDVWNCWSMVLLAMYRAGQIDRPGMAKVLTEMRTHDKAETATGGLLYESGSRESASQLTLSPSDSDKGGEVIAKVKDGESVTKPLNAGALDKLVEESGVQSGDVIIASSAEQGLGAVYSHVGTVGEIDGKVVALHFYDSALVDVRTAEKGQRIKREKAPVQATPVGEFIIQFIKDKHKVRFVRPNLAPYKKQ
jgi:Domain of unknown function (DUF4157)